MDITVAICTWNRSKLLDQTLAEMHHLPIPDGVNWELLVVNNNCTDDTDVVIARHAEMLPIRRLFEAKQGLSNARNCVVEAARGEWIVWTDDDVLVDTDWLLAYLRAMRLHPDAEFFGGPISPWFEGTPPRWLRRVWPQVANAYAIRDLGNEPIALSSGRLPFGANFAICTEAQRRFKYDPRTGRNGTGMIGGEETTVMRAMLAAGHRGVWVPDARVRHFIPRSRQTTTYLRRYYHGQGEFAARTSPLATTGDATLFGGPRWMWRVAIQSELRYRVRRWIAHPESWIDDLVKVSQLWGQVDAYCNVHNK